MPRFIALKASLHRAIADYVILHRAEIDVEDFSGNLVEAGLRELAEDGEFHEKYPAYAAAHGAELNQTLQYEPSPEFENLQSIVKIRRSLSGTKAVREALLRFVLMHELL